MKTLARPGLAVCFALTSTCTSLSLVYSSLGGQKQQPPQQQPAAATRSAQRSAESSPLPRPEAPTRPRSLHGYPGVADHKGDLQHLAQHWPVHNDNCPGALRQDQCLWHGAPRLLQGSQSPFSTLSRLRTFWT
nr:alpha-N-acetylgalactosaminide alpha-2,6-sialyltransferase 5-like [Kogia breviceps]